MAKAECTTELTLTEQEVMALKSVLENYQKENIEQFGLSTYQIELLNGINKVLPDWFRAYNSEED